MNAALSKLSRNTRSITRCWPECASGPANPDLVDGAAHSGCWPVMAQIRELGLRFTHVASSIDLVGMSDRTVLFYDNWANLTSNPFVFSMLNGLALKCVSMPT